MDPEAETNEGNVELSEETQKLAALGRGEEVEEASEESNSEENHEEANKPERPAHVPEKFWDAEKGEVNLDNLLKSYAELEKNRGKKEEEKGGEEEDGGKGEEEEGGSEEQSSPFTPEAVNEAVSLASTEVADTGNLSAETNQKFLDMGFSQQYIDMQVAAVKALSAALTAQVYEAAGGEEDYKAAIKWAGENWDKGKIAKFDTGLGDPDLREALVKGLMVDYRTANPGEGKQTRGGGGAGSGDTYTNHDEFQQDLAKADAENDPVARRKAIEKLERSRKAKTLTSRPNRPGLARFG